MQAIETRYLGPTNSRGARIIAQCDAGRITVSWDYALGISENHAAAARKLIDQLGWWSHGRHGVYGDWFQGGTKTGSVFVCAVDYAKVDAPAAAAVEGVR